MDYLDANGLAKFYDGLKKRFVSTINGVHPDQNGNVVVTGDGATVGDMVTDHSLYLDPANWIYPSSDVNVYAGQNSFQFVTIPNSSPTDTPFVYYAIDYSNGKALTSELIFVNTMTNTARANGSSYALDIAGEEAAEDKWAVIRRYNQNSITTTWHMELLLFHGGNGTGAQTWFGNRLRNGGDLVLDSDGHAMVRQLFAGVSATKDNVSIAKNDSAAIELTISVPSGYELCGVRGWRINNGSSSGGYCSMCRLYRLTYSGNTVTVNIRNASENNTAKIKMEVYMLCARTHVY